MPVLVFNRVVLFNLFPGTDVSVTIPSTAVWKIESAGIGGTKGVIYLKANATDKIAILFSSIGEDEYAAPLPFWLGDTFTGGYLRNESAFQGSVSITEYLPA